MAAKPCKRRQLLKNQTTDKVFCKPPDRTGVPAEVLLSDTKQWFRKREVSWEICAACQESEPAIIEEIDMSLVEGSRSEVSPIPQEILPPEKTPTTQPAAGTPQHGKPRIMPDGTIAYPKRGWEPPPPPDGYKRKSDNLQSSDAWVFVPDVPDCPHRARQETRRTSCGCLQFVYTCKLHGEIKTKRCLTCEDRPT